MSKLVGLRERVTTGDLTMTAQPITLIIPRWMILIGIAAHFLIAVAIIIAHTSGIHHRPPAGEESFHDNVEIER